MKTYFITALTLLLGATAWAAPTLDEVAKDKSLMASVPVFTFGSIFVHVTDLCTDGTNVRPVHPYAKKCTARSGRDSACSTEKLVYLSAPIRYLATECSEWRYVRQDRRCLTWLKVEKDHPLSYEIPVYRTGRKDPFNRPEFTIEYTIPRCEN